MADSPVNALKNFFSGLMQGSRGAANVGGDSKADTPINDRVARFLEGIVQTNRTSTGNTSELVSEADDLQVYKTYLEFVEKELLHSDTAYPSREIFFELQNAYKKSHEEAQKTFTRSDTVDLEGHNFYFIKTDNYPGDEPELLKSWVERYHPGQTSSNKNIYIVKNEFSKFCVLKTPSGVFRSFKLNDSDEKILKGLKVSYLFNTADTINNLESEGREIPLGKLLFSFSKTVKNRFESDAPLIQPNKTRKNTLNRSVKKINHKLYHLYKKLGDETLDDSQRSSIVKILKKDLAALEARIAKSEQDYIRSQRKNQTPSDDYRENRLTLSLLKEMQAEYALYLEQIEDANHERNSLTDEELKRLTFLNKCSVLWSDYLLHQESYNKRQRRYLANKVIYFALRDLDWLSEDMQRPVVFQDSIEQIGTGAEAHTPYKPIGLSADPQVDRNRSALKRQELAHFLQHTMQLDGTYSQTERPALSPLRTEKVLQATTDTKEFEKRRIEIQKLKQQLELKKAKKLEFEQLLENVAENNSAKQQREKFKLEYVIEDIEKLKAKIENLELKSNKQNLDMNDTYYSSEKMKARWEQMHMAFHDRYPVPEDTTLTRKDAHKSAGMYFMNREAVEQQNELRREVLRQEELSVQLSTLEKEVQERMKFLATDKKKAESIKKIEMLENSIKRVQQLLDQSRQNVKHLLNMDESDEEDLSLDMNVSRTPLPTPVM